VGGVLLWIAAAIHFLALPLLDRTIAAELPAEAYAFVQPPLVLSFVVDGILLVPLGFTAIYAAGGVRRGERWGWVLGLVSGVTVLVLPVVLLVVMGTRYFSAKPFLVAALAVAVAGLVMVVPLLRVSRHGAGA
jgi:hypothetical protein